MRLRAAVFILVSQSPVAGALISKLGAGGACAGATRPIRSLPGSPGGSCDKKQKTKGILDCGLETELFTEA